jgi:molybdopterin converting factor subunit 1
LFFVRLLIESFGAPQRGIPLRVMTVAVLLFASYADLLGGDRIAVDLPNGSSVRDLVDHVRSLPGADRLPPTLVVAVNQQYATTHQRLTPGDEVALIPPVAGG